MRFPLLPVEEREKIFCLPEACWAVFTGLVWLDLLSVGESGVRELRFLPKLTLQGLGSMLDGSSNVKGRR